MKRRSKLGIVALVLAVLSITVAYSALSYTLRSTYKTKSYIVPATKHIDLGTLYSDVDGESGSKTGESWGTWKVWDTNVTFNIALSNSETLTSDFESFSITLIFGVDENVTVSLGDPNNSIVVDQGTGSLTYDMAWVTKADIGEHETTRTNLAIIDITK